MLLDLIAIFSVGLGAAGIVMGLPRGFGRRAPRWLPPVAGGLAMFAFMLWSEYSWFERAKVALPPDSRIASQAEYSSPLQPWTLFRPRVVRFAAVTRIRSNPALPDARLAEVWLVVRFQDPQKIPVLFDCARGQHALVEDTVSLSPDMALEGRDWQGEGLRDPLIVAACDPDGDPAPDGGNNVQTGPGG